MLVHMSLYEHTVCQPLASEHQNEVAHDCDVKKCDCIRCCKSKTGLVKTSGQGFRTPARGGN